MHRDFRLQIEDILTAITRIRAYIQGMSNAEFIVDFKTQDAVVRNLEIIGEAARSLPDDVKVKVTTVDWRKIISLRNVLIHEYFGISLPIIWDVVSNKLDDLEAECTRLARERD